MAIRIDVKTGLKLFDTRSIKGIRKLGADGYAVNSDPALKTLPPEPEGAVFNAEEQRRYREFKEARTGAADYIPMDGQFSHYLQDANTAEPIERKALDDECEILVVGALSLIHI